jgi:hypothetical protein
MYTQVVVPQASCGAQKELSYRPVEAVTQRRTDNTMSKSKGQKYK